MAETAGKGAMATRIPAAGRCAVRILALTAAVVCAQAARGETRKSAASQAPLSWTDAAVVGIVEGATEFLPVSSTGHVYVTEELLGITERDEAGAASYAICVQAGAILAIIALYRRRFRQFAEGVLGRDPDGLRLLKALVVAWIPAVVAGLSCGSFIKNHLFGFRPIVIGWFAGGILILASGPWRDARKSRNAGTLEDLTMRQALLVGIIQCLALWPGISRSLVTILGGLLIGLALPHAIELSFLLGVLTLGSATVYEGLREGDAILRTYGAGPALVGLAAAAVSAAVSVLWMVEYLKKRGLAIFGWYRVALALLVGLAHELGFV